MRGRLDPRVAVGVVVLLGAVAFAATRVSSLQGTPAGSEARGENPAPELTGIAGWLNAEPLTLKELRGRVVLIDFWAYSCVNCVRTFPHLRMLYERYHASGLEIVGVHSPEFAFEEDIANVRGAIARHRLPYPVALDNDMATWRAFGNNYWPRVYVIDAKGSIRFDHIGEGGEREIEAAIRRMLGETGARLPAVLGMEDAGPHANITPEIYAGHERGGAQGSLANVEGYRPGEIVDYAPVLAGVVEQAGTTGAFFLEGKWSAEREYVQAEEPGARVRLRFRAADVFFVAAPRGGTVEVRILLDGRPADPGIVVVDRSDLFRAIDLGAPETHELTIVAREGFRLYTFTFG